MKLTDREWKPFFLSSIFPEPQRGKRIVNENHIEGKMPLVSSAGDNNGVTHFIGNTEKVRIYNNCISIANGGSSAGRAFYEPFEFIASDHVTHCKNETLTENQYLALASLLSGKLPEKYSFSREITDYRISRERIMLPVDADGEADFSFLEKYVEAKRKCLIDEYIKFAKLNISDISFKNLEPIECKDWKEFKIKSVIGESVNAKAYHKESLKLEFDDKDALPYITRTSINNGLYSVVQNNGEYVFNPANSISLGAENATYFYQPYKYITGNKMYYYQNKKLSKYSALFIVCCLNKAVSKSGFGYGLGLTGTRSDTRTVLLPANAFGHPDYEYMEQYIKNLMIKKYNDYLAYAKK